MTGGARIGEIGLAPTEFAGPVTGGQRDGLVQEEKLGIGAGLHDGAMPGLVSEIADDPGLVAPSGAAKGLAGVVENASIAHEEPARGIGDDIAGGKDSVLMGHRSLDFGNSLGRLTDFWKG